VRLFYTGPLINAELLVAMLEKHGIRATHESESENDPDDLNQVTKVFVSESDYERACQLFYREREDEL
jgi:hypothetical protein